MALSLKTGSKSRCFAAIPQPVVLNEKTRDSIESRGLMTYQRTIYTAPNRSTISGNFSTKRINSAA